MGTAAPPMAISVRATTIARGLIRTHRALGVISQEYGMLRIRCRNGGSYWIRPDGRQILRGRTLTKADELEPKFIHAMERAGW